MQDTCQRRGRRSYYNVRERREGRRRNFENDERADSRFREEETRVGPMLYRLGRLLQLAGMIMLPLAIAGNLAPENPLELRTSLMLSGIGIVVFIVGWLIQQAGKAE